MIQCIRSLKIQSRSMVHVTLLSYLGSQSQSEHHYKTTSSYEKRLRSQMKRLSTIPEQLEAYDGIVQEQLKSGIVERVPEKEVAVKHYIRHHAVIREGAESTKVRIVFDASAKQRQSGRSLNECLHKGPALIPMLFDIILRYRMYAVALVGDVQKAFHQIEVSEEDRDCLRFLWMEDPNDVCSKDMSYFWGRA